MCEYITKVVSQDGDCFELRTKGSTPTEAEINAKLAKLIRDDERVIYTIPSWQAAGVE